MNDFETLVYLLDEKVKMNIKEGDYIDIMRVVAKIYKDKVLVPQDISDDEDENAEYGGQYYWPCG